jgi:hypothetical protein
MFGTLYITPDRENLSFGLDGPNEAPLMSHSLGPILIDPLRLIFFRRARIAPNQNFIMISSSSSTVCAGVLACERLIPFGPFNNISPPIT